MINNWLIGNQAVILLFLCEILTIWFVWIFCCFCCCIYLAQFIYLSYSKDSFCKKLFFVASDVQIKSGYFKTLSQLVLIVLTLLGWKLHFFFTTNLLHKSIKSHKQGNEIIVTIWGWECSHQQFCIYSIIHLLPHFSLYNL